MAKMQEINQEIIDLIAPLGMEFNKTYFMMGDLYCKTLTITNYMSSPKMGWESRICNIEGVVYKTICKKIESQALMEFVSTKIKNAKARMLSSSEEIIQSRSKKTIKDCEELIKKVDQEQEAVFNKTILIMITASDLESLNKKVSRLIGKIAAMGMKLKPLTQAQKEGYLGISPFNFIGEEITHKAEHNMPISTIVGGFPFSHSGLNDQIGIVLGEDRERSPIVLDIWKRKEDRTNSNLTVLGGMGQGKSSTIKKIAYNEWLKGTKIIICDPQSEYKEFCKSVGGSWINLGAGKGGRINPLEVKDIPEDDDFEEDDKLYKGSYNLGALALHFQTLRTFFKLYSPSFNDVLLAKLEEILEEAYRQKGIDYDTKITKELEFPILEDVYQLALLYSDKFDETKSASEVNEYKKIASLLRSMSIGADKGLWNGETNVKADNDFICIDTSDLQKADERIQRTQYFNILSWCWDIATKNREEKILLIFDEAYLLVDETVPEALMFMRNASKQIRKYEGGLIVISHSAVDFLHEKIKRHGQIILEGATYKFLMGTEAKDLKELQDLYNLTEAELEILNSKRRGQGLLFAGNKRIHATIKLEPHEKRIFGKGGGR